MTAFRGTLRRISADFRIASDIGQYEKTLRYALDYGYQLVSLRTADGFFQDGCPRAFIALRHDVDSPNHRGDRMFFEVERRLGARSTFYFRMGTWKSNRGLIRDLLRNGFEVGYHYEEAAAVALLRGARRRCEVFAHRQEIRDRFRANCRTFRREVCADLVSVCSHGDWINRALRFVNREFVDPYILAEENIRFEAYDIAERCAAYLSDTGAYGVSIVDRSHWKGGFLPQDEIDARLMPLCLLAHARNWHPDWRSNSMSNLVVLGQRLAWRWRRRRDPIPSC
jgi:hypothetical protein